MKIQTRELLNKDTSKMTLDEKKDYRDKLKAIVDKQASNLDFWVPFTLGFSICTLLVIILLYIKEHIIH